MPISQTRRSKSGGGESLSCDDPASQKEQNWCRSPNLSDTRDDKGQDFKTQGVASHRRCQAQDGGPRSAEPLPPPGPSGPRGHASPSREIIVDAARRPQGRRALNRGAFESQRSLGNVLLWSWLQSAGVTRDPLDLRHVGHQVPLDTPPVYPPLHPRPGRRYLKPFPSHAWASSSQAREGKVSGALCSESYFGCYAYQRGRIYSGVPFRSEGTGPFRASHT